MSSEKTKTLADNIYSNNYKPSPQKNNDEFKQNAEKLKTKLDEISKKSVKKFKFIKAIGIIPTNAIPFFEEDENIPKEVCDTKPIHLIYIIPEEEYKNLAKIKTEILEIIKESKENVWATIKSAEIDLWNYGLDSKFEMLDAIATSYPLHDDGFLGALRVSIIHKNLVLNWLNTNRLKYVATYAIGGSLVRGTAIETSDVDTIVIIDDTDVKRMSKVELVEKLRNRIVYEFVKEATALAGVKNPLNVQVWLLTDFWQRVKDAEPVAFTFIRDAIPLFDRGTFIPWKRLLQMGKIKPSQEAIDLYMKESDRTEELVKRRLMDAMVDVYYGVLTPTQALMMLAGHAPPVPKTAVQEVEEVLVKKEKLMTQKELKTLEKVVKLFKAYEHGTLKEISGTEIDALLKESKDYSKRMKELREKLEKNLQKQQAEKIEEETLSLMKNLFSKSSANELIKEFEKEITKKGKAPEKMLSTAKDVLKIKEKLKNKSLSLNEIQRLTREAYELNTLLVEYAQRKDLAELERGIIKISYNEKKAEVVLTEKEIFIVQSDGKIKKEHNGKIIESDKSEFEKALQTKDIKNRRKFNSQVISALQKEYGEFEIVL